MSPPLERITWELYAPLPNVTIHAEFSYGDRNRRNGSRWAKLRGSTYTSNKYDTAQDVMSLEISCDAYVVMKHADFNPKSKDGHGKTVISYPHMPRFLTGLEDAVAMMTPECFRNVTDSLYLLSKFGESVFIKVSDLVGTSSIAFQPTVIYPYYVEGEEEPPGGVPGVRVYINGWDHYSEVTTDAFISFVHFYQRFDLFATSLAAANVGVAHLGGIPGAAPRTAAPQPVRRPSAVAPSKRK